MLKDRLKEVRNHLKLSSAKKLSDLIGVPEYIIKDLESGKTQTIKPELATHIEDLCKISGWWLLTGRGKMLFGSSEYIEDFSNLDMEIDIFDKTENPTTGLSNYDVFAKSKQ